MKFPKRWKIVTVERVKGIIEEDRDRRRGESPIASRMASDIDFLLKVLSDDLKTPSHKRLFGVVLTVLSNFSLGPEIAKQIIDTAGGDCPSLRDMS